MRKLTFIALPLLFTGCPADGTTTAGTTQDAADTDTDTTGTGGETTPTTTVSGATDTSTGVGPSSDGSTTGTSTQASETDATETGVTGTSETGASETGASETGATGTGTTTDTSTSTGPVSECEPGASEPCYSGEPETLGVGLCVGGERTCDDLGLWGACIGEVVPAPASCDDAGDEACDGEDPCGAPEWSRVFGSPGDQWGQRVAFDGAGNLVLAARGVGTIDFGGGPLISSGGDDLFLARFAPDGKHLWSKRYGDAAQQFNDTAALAVNAAGDIVIAGDFAGALDLGGGPLIAKTANDGFVARLGPDGGHVWSKAFTGASFAVPHAVAFTGAGDVLVAGGFDGTVDLGGGPLVSGGSSDAFVARFGPDGAHKASKRYGAGGAQVARGVVGTAGGGLCFAGLFEGAFDLGTGLLVGPGGFDVYVACLDAQGKTLWAKSFGDPKYQQLNDLVIDSAGHLTFGGETEGAIDLGGGPIGGGGGFPSYIAQLDAKDGAHLWSRLISDADSQLRGIGIDGADSLLLTGNYRGVSDFGGGVVGYFDQADVFLVKLDAAGGFIWGKVFGSFEQEIGFDVAGSPDGLVAFTGQFNLKIDVGGGVEKTKGAFDGFVGVFKP